MVKPLDYEMRDGYRIPALGLGTWMLKGARCTAIVKRAIELGYKHIDTADMYGNHEEIGEAIKGVDRASIFLVSKVRPNNLQYHSVIRDCNRNLRELGTDYFDLYLIHWPNKTVPIQETLRAFNELVDEGKIKSIGVSNFTIHHLNDALRAEYHPISNNQVRFHPYDHDPSLLKYCHKQRIVVTAYSPLGKARILSHTTIQKMAKKYKHTSAQICLRWGLQKGVVVIPKTQSKARLIENMDIFNWEISQEDMKRLDSLT
ncbi:MAG: aldo/keto reductase [Candidatus Bathyarchaeota archaeon]|nr:MAG: aldo/keto reductase [Candidatus Bathyarchaeota archaeon]